MKLSYKSKQYLSSLLRSEVMSIERALGMVNLPEVARASLLKKRETNKKAYRELNPTDHDTY